MTNSVLAQEDARLAITDILLVEHRILRELMAALEHALLEKLPPNVLRERPAMVEVALDTHARREEEQLLTPLRTRSETARHLVDMMELVHDEVRALFEEIQSEPDPMAKLWTILEMTEAHFETEERKLFPLARTLMSKEEMQQPVTPEFPH